MKASLLSLAALALLASCAFQSAYAGETVGENDVALTDRVTTELIIEQGRPFVNVAVTGPGGTTETTRFLVDTGGGAFIVPESVARAIGIEWDDTFVSQQGGQEFARPAVMPKAFLQDYRLPLVAERVLIAIDREESTGIETGLFPGHLLAQHHVIFDYPGRTMMLAAPGSIDPSGDPMDMSVSSPMGFPRTEIQVAGETYGMLLDTGPPATIVSRAVVADWADLRPDWQHQEGAVGETESLAEAGGQVLGTMVIEDVRWGGFTLDRLTVASQREGVFEQFMSRMMTEPVVGALGSNAFMDVRLELDYLNETLYVTRPNARGTPEE